MVQLLDKATAKFECRVAIYTFMPDHIHILVTGTTDEADSYRSISHFKTLAGVWFYSKRLDLSLQGDCYDHVVRYFEGWEQQAKYIALNPVRKGLCPDVASWPYTGSIGYDLSEILAEAFW